MRHQNTKRKFVRNKNQKKALLNYLVDEVLVIYKIFIKAHIFAFFKLDCDQLANNFKEASAISYFDF